MKKGYKIISCLLILIMMLFLLPTFCNADGGALSGIVTSGDDFVNNGKNQTGVGLPSTENIKDTSNLIYNTLFGVGIIVALIWGLIIGIKFVTGSIEEKAQIKEKLIPYVIGCVIIFGAFGIWKICVTIFSQLQ